MSVITFSKDKRAISIMIGYILLITSAVVMSAIVYQYLKSYVPKDTSSCPDGVSLYVVNSNCTPKGDNYELRLQLRNNGRFDIGGYFIHGADSPDQKLAAIDLSPNLLFGGQISNKAVVFISQSSTEVSNFLNPNDEIAGVFNTTKKLYSIELIPVRYQVEDNKKQLVSCGNAKIVENLNCDAVVQEQCTPDCTDKNCGDDGCGGSCGTCDSGFKCEANSCVEDLCGNGVVDGDEECDGVVGCGEDCLHLSGYNCFPSTNTCYPI